MNKLLLLVALFSSLPKGIYMAPFHALESQPHKQLH